MSKFFIILLLLNLVVFPVQAANNKYSSEKHSFYVDQIAKGFDVIWGMALITPTKLIVTERDGDIYLLDINSKQKTKVRGHPNIEAKGQGGMLDVVINPLNRDNNQLFFTYAKSTKNGQVTTLASAELQGHNLVNWRELLASKSATSRSKHFGSRIAFDGQGQVFFSIGDRGVRESSQDLSNHNGAILRLKLDGSTPSDNPFVNDKAALNEIWSYGHRNPQGLVYDHKYQRLWSIEHGPRGGDEINLIEKGNNYGWPEVSQGKEYWGPISVGVKHKTGMTEPKKVYTPSIAPGGLALYQADKFKHWQGNLFAGALKLAHLNRVEIDKDGNIVHEERLLASLSERIRAVITGSDGYIYISTDSGKVLRLRPA